MHQSGFRTNHSRLLSCSVEFVLAGTNEQVHTIIILADLQKPFDTLDHGFILKKCNILVAKHLLISLSLISQT